MEMARTTFYRHKCAIEDIFGIYIDCDRQNGNKYFIGNANVLRAYGAERNYMRDLPLHHSQHEINVTADYCDFELTLRPTSDFKAQLLSRGQWLEVMEPQVPTDEIVEWHQNAINRYRKQKK